MSTVEAISPRVTAAGVSVERATTAGAVRAIAVTTASAPAGFLIVVILGRTSPEALGFYALATLLVSLFGGLLTFGGPAVAARAAVDTGHSPSVATYLQAFVAPPLAAVIGVAVAAGPLHGRISVLGAGCLAASVTLWVAAQGFATANLRYGLTALLQSLPTITQFLLFAALWRWENGVFRAHMSLIILASYVVPTAGIGAWFCLGLPNGSKPRRWPKANRSRFVRLAVGMEVIVALTFVFESGERIAALAAPNALGTLGRYFAGVQIAYLVRRVPAIVGQAVLPGLTRLRGTGRASDLHDRASAVVTVTSFAIATALAVTSHQVTLILGSSYGGTALVISFVAIASASASSWPLDASMATAVGRLRLYQASLIGGTIAFAPLLLSQRLWLLGLSRAAALVIAQCVMLRLMPERLGARSRRIAVVLSLGTVEIIASRAFPAIGALVAIWLFGILAFSILTVGLGDMLRVRSVFAR